MVLISILKIPKIKICMNSSLKGGKNGVDHAWWILHIMSSIHLGIHCSRLSLRALFGFKCDNKVLGVVYEYIV